MWGLAIIFLWVAICLGVLLLVRRRVPLERLREQHDVAAACFAVVGGLYGIVLAFVLVSSWERFEEARQRVEMEANALADLYRHAGQLPAPFGDRLRTLVVGYARSTIDEEWPALARGEQASRTQADFEEIWQAFLDAPQGDGKELVLYQNSLGKLDDFSDARRDRLLYARVGLPWVLWTFLIASGAVTISFSYFFGLPRISSQLLMTAMLAATIGSALVLIRELQTPFSGSVRITPFGFEQLLLGLPPSPPPG